MREELTLAELDAAAERVYRHVPPTPRIRWPLLSERCGCEVWVKHENHTPTGTFKVRGAVNYMALLRARRPCVRTVVTAGDGSHGASVAWVTRRLGMAAVVVVPRDTSAERIAALRALGVEPVVEGADHEAALEHAQVLSATRSQHMVPAFHKWLVQGAASAALEFLRAVPDLDAMLVPLGFGTALCGAIAARDALGLSTRIVGVVSDTAPAFALSFREGRPVEAPVVPSAIVGGLGVRLPDDQALTMALDGAADILTVSVEDIASAMATLFTTTHNPAEGAGAASLAGLLARREDFAGKRVGVMLTGGNAETEVFARVRRHHTIIGTRSSA